MASRTRNPLLVRSGFDALVGTAEEPMTLGGTIGKTLLLLALAAAGASYAWYALPRGTFDGLMLPVLVVGVVGGFGLSWYTARHPETAMVTGPIYAVVQGFLLGAVSLVYNRQYAGLPVQAVALTGVTLGTMLALYRTGIIRPTERLKTVVVSCTAAIIVFYLLAFAASVVDLAPPFILGGGPIGIGFSLFVVALAAFNLILDFELIEEGIGRAPASFEWYAAFGLVVTLLWLYLEMLRLLRKLRR